MALEKLVSINKYLPILCDPNTREPLELLSVGEPKLRARNTGTLYSFKGTFPDLRPWAGLQNQNTSSTINNESFAKQKIVDEHYDDKPCNNYLSLDNVPLGKYLRNTEYDKYFDNAETVIEVGCGKGAITRVLKQYRFISPLCIDLAYGSIAHIKNSDLNADGILGSNLALPVCDAVADLVISYGVIHHTPNPFLCFRELSRILKPGGYLLLNVYNWNNLYRKLYHAINPVLTTVQQIFGKKIGDFILKYTIFLPYHLILWGVLAITQRKLQFPNFQTSWEQFGDFFLTPIAQFYHTEELISMGETLGLKLIEHETGGWPENGFAHFCWFQKL